MHPLIRVRFACRRIQRRGPRLAARAVRRTVSASARAVVLGLVPSSALDVVVQHKPFLDAVESNLLPTLAGLLWTMTVMDASVLLRKKSV